MAAWQETTRIGGTSDPAGTVIELTIHTLDTQKPNQRRSAHRQSIDDKNDASCTKPDIFYSTNWIYRAIAIHVKQLNTYCAIDCCFSLYVECTLDNIFR